jgi:hypothetical protein
MEIWGEHRQASGDRGEIPSLLVKGLRWCLREEITDHSLGEGELFTGTISRPLSWTKGIHSFEKE